MTSTVCTTKHFLPEKRESLILPVYPLKTNVLNWELAKSAVENVKKEQMGTAIAQSLCSVGCVHTSSGEWIFKTAGCYQETHLFRLIR